ncbi:MAG TPA: sensor histidine kinase [Nocardioides sp.]|uniref:sensor histidine kinase n=1 Tax=Nocardioides sp. TaxID=35761 RepID=UPI002C18417F|nr:sensor histidine kinase [Nocardioides sp.]HTW16401.1 sensor histidine kinase [Nocardioides sp.]
MATMRYPGESWNWRGSALIVALAATPPALMWCLDEGVRSWSAAATASQLTIAPLVLLAAAALYVQYKVVGDRIYAWLSLGIALLGVQSLSLAIIRLGGPDGFLKRGSLIELADIVLVLVLLSLARAPFRARWRVDPLGVGLLAGLVLTVAHLRLLERIPALDLSGRLMLVLHAGTALAGIAIALRLSRTRGLPAWATARMTAAVLLFMVNRAATCQPTDTALTGMITVASGVAATVLLVGVTAGTLRMTVWSQITRLERVSEQLAEAEGRLNEQRARLHEITNSIAGIASASSLIRRRVDLTAPHQVRLEQMLERESARLARLLMKQRDQQTSQVAPLSPPPEAPIGLAVPERDTLSPTTDTDREVVDLDEVLTPLVVAQEAVDHPVTWTPSGLSAYGNADDVAEAVNILLDNARKHAPSAATRLQARTEGEQIEIVVSDDGPGVAPEVREDLFVWGRHGDDSHGQGLGLHLARRRLHDSDASLELVPSEVGSTFVITLPSLERVGS